MFTRQMSLNTSCSSMTAAGASATSATLDIVNLNISPVQVDMSAPGGTSLSTNSSLITTSMVDNDISNNNASHRQAFAETILEPRRLQRSNIATPVILFSILYLLRYDLKVLYKLQ